MTSYYDVIEKHYTVPRHSRGHIQSSPTMSTSVDPCRSTIKPTRADGELPSSWVDATKRLRSIFEIGAVLVPSTVDEDAAPIAHMIGNNALAAQSCTMLPGKLVDVPHADYVVVRTDRGDVQLWHRIHGNYVTLTKDQETGVLKICDHYALIHSIRNGENQVQIINLACLCNEPPVWLTKTMTWGKSGCGKDGIVDVCVTGTLLIVMLTKSLVITADGESPATYTAGHLTGRSRSAAGQDIFLGVVGLVQENFLALIHSPNEGLIRVLTIDARAPKMTNRYSWTFATLKTDRSCEVEVVQSASNGAILKYGADDGGGVVYSVMWKSLGNEAIRWDGVNRLKRAVVGDPVHLVVDPASTARKAVMLTAYADRFEVYVLNGATGDVTLLEAQKCMPLSDPFGALYVPQCMNPKHAFSSEVELCASAVGHLLRRFWVTTQVLEATKKHVNRPATLKLEGEMTAKIELLQASLKDIVASFKQLRIKHKDAVHRYETVIATKEHEVKQVKAELANTVATGRTKREQQRLALQAEARHERRRAKEATEEAQLVRSKLDQAAAAQKAANAKLHDVQRELDLLKDDQLKEAMLGRAMHESELQTVRDEHAAEVARMREEHAAEVARMREEHAAAVAKVQAEKQTELAARESDHAATIQTAKNEVDAAQGKLKDALALRNVSTEHGAEPAGGSPRLVETLRLEVARLTEQCYDQQGRIMHLHALCAGLIDPIFNTPLPQLAEQVRHLSQFKRDNAVLYQQVAELRAQLSKQETP